MWHILITAIYNLLIFFASGIHTATKKALGGDANTTRCMAVVRRNQKFRPAADPLPGGAGRLKCNQLEMIFEMMMMIFDAEMIFAYEPSLVRIDARNVELSW